MTDTRYLSATIYLYGPPGSGKTTLGKSLAEALNLSFLDLDEEIEKGCGRTIPQIFVSEGESAFRELEERFIQQLASVENGVIALGGGSLVSPMVRELVQARGDVLCLQASPEVLLNRLSHDTQAVDSRIQRPLLAGNLASRLADLLSQRAAHYDSFPVQLDTTSLEPEQAVWQAQIRLGRFRVRNSGRPYDVRIQAGGLDGIGKYLAERGIQESIVLVTDTNVGPRYTDQAITSLQSQGIFPSVVTVPAGEQTKTMAHVEKLWDTFFDQGLERTSTVLALGGGVVGDLAGFAAATYMRGIRWVNLPTTLLAMVDASLGGKTGVDTQRGKNLVGAFHPPAFVLADPQVLVTLPERELRSGIAEVIKHGILFDPGLIEMVAANLPRQRISNLSGELISRAMAVKVKIIEEDPYEQGVRAALNLGHTIGHAIEVISGYRLRHGEAVAIGMVVEARLAERLDLAEPGLSLVISSTLERMGLPVQIPSDMDRAAIRKAIGFDKKKSQGRVRFALPTRIGKVQTGLDVPDEILASEI